MFLSLRTEYGLRLLGSIARSRILLLVVVLHILCGERAFRIAHSIVANLLIAAEIGALKGTLRRSDLGEHVRIEFVPQAVPIEFLTLINQAVDIADAHPPPQMPQLLLVVLPCCIGLHISLDMKLLVELLEEDTLLKCPSRG